MDGAPLRQPPTPIERGIKSRLRSITRESGLAYSAHRSFRSIEEKEEGRKDGRKEKGDD